MGRGAWGRDEMPVSFGIKCSLHLKALKLLLEIAILFYFVKVLIGN